MSLINIISTDRLLARKRLEKERSTFLTTLLGEALIAGKDAGNRESTDEEVLKVVSKFYKNAKENAERWNHRNMESQRKRQEFLNEMEILKAYMPDQLSKDEIKNILVEAFRDADVSPKLRGEMMKHMKTNHADMYDSDDAIGEVNLLLNSGATKI